MFTKVLMPSLLMVLAGCTTVIAQRGVPDIAEGGQSRWVYGCEEGTVAVEYANRGGRYTAMVETDEGKRVLDIETRSPGVVATLPPLKWESANGNFFTLSDGENIIREGCRALRETEKANISLSLDNVFSK